MTIPDIAAIEQMNNDELRAAWDQTDLSERPSRISADLMRRMVADRLQRQGHPNLPTEPAIRRTLERNLRDNRSTQSPIIQPGTVLSRDWNGHRHTVRVTSDGYEWDGETYRSLSKIALLITGTRWSGPRFFGVQS